MIRKYIFTLIFSLAILAFNIYLWFFKMDLDFSKSEFIYIVQLLILTAAFFLGFLNFVLGTIVIIKPGNTKLATLQKWSMILLLLIAIPFVYVFLQTVSGEGALNYYIPFF